MTLILTTIGLLLGLLCLTIPVAAVLGIIGLALADLYSPMPLWRAIGEVTWKANNEFVLVAVPLYILLGEILLRSGIAERMYTSMAQWLSWLPGGLMHSNVGACAMFAATSGSSVATAATIGTVALDQIKKYGYNERLFLGTLASGGTLGILIPPSIVLIIYGVLTNTSIPTLYLAGMLPGAVLAFLFMLTVVGFCLFRPDFGGRKVETTWDKRISTLPDLVPPILIFVLVIGSIYAGLATPTESAALGVLGALVLAAVRKRLSLTMMRQAVEATIRVTAMNLGIVMAAYFLNFVFTFIGLTTQVTSFVGALGLPPYGLIAVVIAFYVLLGMFMETLSMMIATVPIIAPLVIAAGFDPIWFGIVMMMLIETALITPPVGVNLFVIQSVRRRGYVHDVMIGAAPFVVTLMIMITLLVIFPEIALWLPKMVTGYSGY